MSLDRAPSLPLILALTLQAACIGGGTPDPTLDTDAFATAELRIERRPFAVEADGLMMNVDGWFDITWGAQKAGVFVINDGDAPACDVTAQVLLPADSGVSGPSADLLLGDIAPGQSVFVLVDLDASGAVPAKVPFTLEFTGATYSGSDTRNIFVAEREAVAYDTATIELPQGTLEATVAGMDWFFADCALAPSTMLWNVDFATPFEGQFSELPFADPWWKAFGIGMVIGAGINMVVDGVAELAGGDYMDAATEKVNNGLGVVGGGAAAADEIDPFRWGEENTLPAAGEKTVREEVAVEVAYDGVPAVGEPFTGEATWSFTRITDSGATYSDSVVRPFQSYHFTTERVVDVDVTTAAAGQAVTLTASFVGQDGLAATSPEPLKGSDLFVTATISAFDGLTKDRVADVVLYDDGSHGDASSGDGVYTAEFVPEDSWGRGVFTYEAWAYDVNKAEDDEDPIDAAQKIAGFMISAPPLAVPGASSPCGLRHDGSFEVF